MPAARGALPARFFRADTVSVARALLGTCLVHSTDAGRVAGRIVETEAYLSEGDPASHSHAGPTARNASMFGPAGHAYVYLIYGMHLCFNVVTGAEGRGEAVLVRAVEPLEGVDLMRSRRGREPVRELCSGPAKLCQAFGIVRAQDGAPLRGGELEVVGPSAFGLERLEPESLRCGPRIGITKAAELPLRFWVAEDRFVSR